MKLVDGQIHSTINLDMAAEIGRAFRAGRQDKKLSAQDVADKLLLSRNQVLGLEIGDVTYFYGVKLYAQSADKYAQFLGLNDRPSQRLFNANAEDIQIIAPPSGPNPTESEIAQPDATPGDTDAHREVAVASPQKSTRHLPRWAMAAVATVLAGIGIQSMMDTPKNNANARVNQAAKLQEKPAAAATITPDPVATAPVEPEKPTIAPPAAATTTTPAQLTAEKTNNIPEGSIRLQFAGSSWVQIVDINGNRQEKTYKDGDLLTLEPGNLQALVIGNAKAVSMVSSQGDVSLNPYVASGSQVARLIGPQIRKLGE